MIIHLLDAHAGRHAVAAAPLLPALLCRMRLRRRPAAPEAYLSASGALPARLLTESQTMATGEFAVLDAKVDALRRPVNGRSLPDQPRRHPDIAPVPAYGTVPVATVLAAEQQAARDLDRQARAEADRAWYVRSNMPSGIGAADAGVLKRVRDALARGLPDATYRGAWQ